MTTPDHDHATHDHHRHHQHNDAAAKKPEPVPPGTIYTCPMHPEIRQAGPGSCPICGMALEPVLASRAGANPELVDMTRRFWIGTRFVAAGGRSRDGRSSDRPQSFSRSTRQMDPVDLATPVVLWAGWPFFVRGWNP